MPRPPKQAEGGGREAAASALYITWPATNSVGRSFSVSAPFPVQICDRSCNTHTQTVDANGEQRATGAIKGQIFTFGKNAVRSVSLSKVLAKSLHKGVNNHRARDSGTYYLRFYEKDICFIPSRPLFPGMLLPPEADL